MALLTLDMWSWIGIAATGWCAFSFGFAFWLGRAIRMSEGSMEAPATRQQPGYRSGVLLDPRQLHDPAEALSAEAEDERPDETRRSGVQLSAIQVDDEDQAPSRRRDATGSH